MPYKAISQVNGKAVQKRRPRNQATRSHRPSAHQAHPAAIIQRAQLNPGSLTRQDVQHLQSTIGNRAVGRLLTQAPRNAGSADSRPVAQRQLAESVIGLPVQRQEGPEEEEGLQMKTDAAVLQRQEMEEEELLQGKMEPVQRQGELEEELIQGKFESVQRQGVEDEELVQGKFATSETPTQCQGVKVGGENRTGMPDSLKGGLEQLSGFDLSGVRVHHNSAKPAQLNALAYAQRQDIHLGPGQEKHLPHEGWHAVQQMQGRVKPTLQAKGVSINDDTALEHEADVMGAKALQMRRSEKSAFEFPIHNQEDARYLKEKKQGSSVIQRNPITDKLIDYLYDSPVGSTIETLAGHILTVIDHMEGERWAKANDALFNNALATKCEHRINLKSTYINIKSLSQEDIAVKVELAIGKGMYFKEEKRLDLPDVALLPKNDISLAQTPSTDAWLARKVLPVVLEEWIHAFQHAINGFLSQGTADFAQTPQAQRNPKWNLNEVDIYALYKNLGWTEVLDAFRARYTERQKYEDFTKVIEKGERARAKRGH